MPQTVTRFAFNPPDNFTAHVHALLKNGHTVNLCQGSAGRPLRVPFADPNKGVAKKHWDVKSRCFVLS